MHFAWRFLESFGEDKLKDVLSLFLKNQPFFTISYGFLEKDGKIFLPKPLKLTPQKQECKNKEEKVISFLKQKESKSRKWITTEQLNLFLNNHLDKFEESLQKSANEKYPKVDSDLRVSVEIDRETNKAKKGQLFSENPKYLDKDIFINIFIKIIDKNIWDDLKCEDILKSVFEIGYGKKKSSGYGHFEVTSFEEYKEFNEPNEANGFLSLSNMLPADDDKICDAYYDYHIKYGKLGEQLSSAANPFKKPLVLLKPGSCFLTSAKKEFYGRAVDNVNDYLPNVIHNGIAFTLKAKL